MARIREDRSVPPEYRFVDRWSIPAPIGRVYDAVGDPLGYERWWTDFVLRATGDPGPPEPGKRTELLVRAYLPYKVNFALEVVEAERPRRIHSRLSKDFDGTGTWTLEETADGTLATLDWRPSVNHPLIRRLTPLLRPLFRSNHTWAMRRGERQLRAYLADRYGPQKSASSRASAAPTCSRPSSVTILPRGVRCRKPSWSRYGS